MTVTIAGLTIRPMNYHGPGWTIDAPTGSTYMLWAPRPATADHKARTYWAASWDRDGGYVGDYRCGATAEQALACIPDDREGHKAHQALLTAATTGLTGIR